MIRRLKLGFAVLAAAGLIAAGPVLWSASSEVHARGCIYYQNWQAGGGSVVCYNPGGTNCAVCEF